MIFFERAKCRASDLNVTHCARFDRNHSVVPLPSAHGQTAINGRAEHDAFVIIGMIAEQFNAPWRVAEAASGEMFLDWLLMRRLLETSRRQEYAFGFAQESIYETSRNSWARAIPSRLDEGSVRIGRQTHYGNEYLD